MRGSAKFSKVRNAVNMTGEQVARRVLNANGLNDVPVEPTKGELTDHYDPRNRTLYLSQAVYATPSIVPWVLPLTRRDTPFSTRGQPHCSFGPQSFRQ